MNVKELREALDKSLNDNAQVVVELSSPSIGVKGHCGIILAYSGFDWNNQLFFLQASEPLVIKSEKEAVFDLAFDLILELSKEKTYTDKPTNRAKMAQRILKLAKTKFS